MAGSLRIEQEAKTLLPNSATSTHILTSNSILRNEEHNF